jgi:cytochrome c5
LNLSLFFPSVCAGKEPPEAIGKKVFMHFCVQCHGEKGKGDGVNAEFLYPKPRDLTDSEEKYMAKLSNQDIIDVITKGGAGVEKAVTMPPWGRKTLSEHEVGVLVGYVRTLHPNEAGPIDYSSLSREKPRVILKEVEIGVPTGKKDVKLGKNYFKKYSCNSCHVVNMLGGESGPQLDNIKSKMKPQEIFKVIKNPTAFKKDSKMPNMDISDEVAVYITLFLLSL